MRAPMPASEPASFSLRDPEAFFQAQKRNRHATWRMSVLSIVAALLMGLPLTLVLTPFLYAVTLAVADVIHYFSPLPPVFWQNVHDLSRVALRVADVVLNQRGVVDPQELTVVVALIFVPGIAVAFLLWLGTLMLFRHGGVGGTLASLNAREPNTADLKELQLEDVVQEMAIAAGLPVPKVMLVDSPAANAAAIGNCADDACIVLSRRLIDDLDRDQLQALLANLIASIGNGDLRIAFTVTSVFETCGLIIALINAPFGRQSRSILWRILRYAFTRRPSQVKAAEAAEVSELLGDMLEVKSTDIERFFNTPRPGLIRKALRIAFFPFQFTNMAVEITLWFFLHALLGPCMALVWRARRYLADAGSVELTRNPDALAAALLRLAADKTGIAGGGWASHLFVVNPQGDRSAGTAGISEEQKRRALEAWKASAAMSAGASGPTSSVASPSDDYLRMRKEMMATVIAAASGDANAVARLQSIALAIGAPAFDQHDMPSANDLVLAQRGDRAAVARLRMLRQAHAPSGQSSRGQTGLQAHSFVSFHAPLNKRVKRLQRMGAQVAAPAKRRSVIATVLLAIAYVVAVPAVAFLGAMMLFLIAIMIMLNLLLLTVWLTAIHWLLAQDWPAVFAATMTFIEQVSRAISNAKR